MKNQYIREATREEKFDRKNVFIIYVISLYCVI